MANRNFKNHDIFIILVENNISVKRNSYHEIAAHIALRKKYFPSNPQRLKNKAKK